MKKTIRIKLILVKKLKSKKTKKTSKSAPEEEGEWLDSFQVMKFLNIQRTAFFAQAGEGNWIVQKRGKRNFYLKSSLIKNQ
ncbi:hypothetical protein [Pedobacter sp. FW305-3-2-15-E-R2A2]|uniref:hypothetical protein n=1 Tax=Pedobacter sp. FW305-3-2-15-E-R2A2 TaxID=3140251 RepID=UPI0031401925